MATTDLFERLSTRSQRNFYDVYSYFEWVPALPADAYLLPPELLTVDGTAEGAALPEETLIRLSHCETVNLFSVFTRGESDLLQTILANCVRAEFQDCFDYLTHFVDEENKHMWFFAEFCRRYHGGLYPVRVLKAASQFGDDAERFLAFVRILVFEEIGDFVNVRVAEDIRVPPLLRAIHRRHHEDEAGHIAAGWQLAARLLGPLAVDENGLARLRAYLETYMAWSIQNLYNPLAYRESGLDDPYGLRTRLLEHPARAAAHDRVLRRARRRLDRVFATAAAKPDETTIAGG
jgi:hypothetical protein